MCGRTVECIAVLDICAAAQNFCAPAEAHGLIFPVCAAAHRICAVAHSTWTEFFVNLINPFLMERAAAQSVCAVAQNQFSNRFPNFCNPILPQTCCNLWFWYRICMQTTISLNKPCEGSIFTKDLVNQNLFQTIFPFLRFSPNFNPNFPHFCGKS